MARVLRMTGLLVVCVGLSILAQGTFSPRQQLKALPDLVVLEATFQDTGPGNLVFLHTYTFGIGIKNNGPGNADLWTKAAVYVVSGDSGQYPVWLFGTVDVSPIAAGDAVMVFVTRQLSVSPAPCSVVIVVDASVTGKPLGQMNEGTCERNNGFVFFLSPSTGLQTFENPAFHP